MWRGEMSELFAEKGESSSSGSSFSCVALESRRRRSSTKTFSNETLSPPEGHNTYSRTSRTVVTWSSLFLSVL